MKRKLFSLTFISLFVSLLHIYAQPVINSSVFGIAGDSYTMKGIDESTFTPGSGGEDITWDFSAADLNGGTEIRNVVEASTSLYAADFPDANLATVTDDTSFTYYLITGFLFSLYGTASPTITEAFDDPADLVNFPVTFGDEKTDDFTGSTTIYGFDVSLTGTSTTTADGYGTIILPGGIYRHDALRIKVNLDITGEVSGLPITAELNSTIYYWLIEGNIGPALQYTFAETIIPGITSTSTTYIDVSNALLIADNVQTIPAIDISVTPNPVNDQLTVSAAHEGFITVYSMNGEKMFCQKSTGYAVMDMSALPVGNYFVEVNTEYGNASEIISVMH